MTSALVVPQHRAPNTVSGSHRGISELGGRRTGQTCSLPRGDSPYLTAIYRWHLWPQQLTKLAKPCQGGAERGQEALTGKFHFVNRNPG